MNNCVIRLDSVGKRESWSIRQEVFYLPIDLKWGSHENDPTLGHRVYWDFSGAPAAKAINP